jgi:hypothetical protein
MVFCSHTSHQFGPSEVTCLVFAKVRLLVLYMCNRQPFMSASDLVTGSYATPHISKALAEAPHWQIIETYWNMDMQQNNILFVEFETRTEEIMKEVC